MAKNPKLPGPASDAILGTIITVAGILVLFSFFAIVAKSAQKKAREAVQEKAARI